MSKDDSDLSNNKNNRRSKNHKNGRKNNKKTINLWSVKVFILTFVIACVFSLVSESTIRNINSLLLAIITLFVIILIGIIFDIVGIAVASADETPFISMASKKIHGAKQAVHLVKNADHVSSFCNDVVGDICGIVSGAAGSVLIMKSTLAQSLLFEESLLSIIISSLIAALTVGGKAIGKSIAINKSHQVVYYTALFLSLFDGTKNTKNRKKIHSARS
ncbi:MAG: Mg2+ and Co2+ transporter CorB [Caldicoprobacteraceae bacterium]